jgi:hypothetical protein
VCPYARAVLVFPAGRLSDHGQSGDPDYQENIFMGLVTN